MTKSEILEQILALVKDDPALLEGLQEQVKAEKKRVHCVRLTLHDIEKLKALGGRRWLEDQIRAAPAPAPTTR